MWKRGQVTWEDCTNVVRGCRDATSKAEVLLELNWAKEIIYVSGKRKTGENEGSVLNEVDYCDEGMGQ